MDISQISYQAYKQGARFPISIKAMMRIILWKEQQGRCHYCDRATTLDTEKFTQRMATIEHICPKSRGGPNHIRNYVMSCHGCNNRRSDMPYRDFCIRMGFDINCGRRRVALKREQSFWRKKVKTQYKAGELHYSN